MPVDARWQDARREPASAVRLAWQRPEKPSPAGKPVLPGKRSGEIVLRETALSPVIRISVLLVLFVIASGAGRHTWRAAASIRIA